MKTYEQMVDLFERANSLFVENDRDLFVSDVNERTLCGALMAHLQGLIRNDPSFAGYYTDVEYNRNQGRIKTLVQKDSGPELKVIRINCDLILHSRGGHPEQDNLIAVEMKKSSRPEQEKESDRERLMALTSDSFDNIWAFDGHSLPEHVCRYVLGVYYEIDRPKKRIMVEYYQKGERVNKFWIPLKQST